MPPSLGIEGKFSVPGVVFKEYESLGKSLS